MILIKLDVKNKQIIDFKKKLERFGAKILEENDLDLIVEFTGSPDELKKIENIVKPYKIIEQTRSGLVSMATGSDYIKKIER